MANNILSTVELIAKANDILTKHSTNLDQATASLNSYINSAKLPSDFVKGVKSIDKAQKDIIKTTKQLEQTEKQMQRQRLSDLKLQKKREQAFDKYEKQLQREQKLLDRTQGLYNRVQRGVNQVTKQYQDLAIRKELNGKLSAEETVQLGMLEAKLNKYQSALKRADANIGKHQRNVGNYKSGFDGLGFSIAQLSREMPAFANSMQTGFMAISNNIPMLVDEITRLKNANVELAASGKPTVNILKRVGSAIFSMNGLLGIGITILTVFGPKLIDWAFGMSEAEKATEEATKELEEQNKALEENIRLRNQQLGRATNVIENVGIIDEFRNILNEVIGDSTRAEAVLSELSERFGELGISDSKILKDQNLLQSDRVRIAFNLLEIEKQKNLLSKERLSIDQALKQETEIIAAFQRGEFNESIKNFKLQQVRNITFKETIRIQERINQLQENNNQIIGKTVDLTIKDTEAKKENRKETEQLTTNSEAAFRKQIAALTKLRTNTEAGSASWKFYDSMILLLEKSLEGLTKGFKKTKEAIGEASIEFPDFQKNMDEARATTDALRLETEKFIQGFQSDFFQQSPFASLEIFANGTFDRLLENADTTAEKFAVVFNTVAEVAKDVFNFINQLQQRNFENERARLEQSKNVALQFAGENTAGREEIERQYEEKRIVLQKRQAKAQKEQAIFGATIGTAQGIVSTIAQLGMPAAIPLIALISAIGAAQIALIQSQQIPQFWQGGEVGSQQRIMVNDDPFGRKGSNYKEVIEKPNGQILTPQGKNVKMTVPKGSYVHPTYDAFINSLDSELLSNNIMPVGQGSIMPMIVNNGLSKNDVLDVMNNHANRLVNTIEKQHGIKINIDENGINKYVSKKGHTSKIMNARYKGTGINV
jgi:hypothetical protein